MYFNCRIASQDNVRKYFLNSFLSKVTVMRAIQRGYSISEKGKLIPNVFHVLPGKYRVTIYKFELLDESRYDLSPEIRLKREVL